MAYRSKFYKDKEKLRETRRNYNRRYYAKTQKYRPRKWTEEEDEIVLAHEFTDTQISFMISRSVKAINVRRCKLKKLKDK